MKLTIGVCHGNTVDGWFFDYWTDIMENPVFKTQIDMTAPISCRSGPDMPAARGRVVGEFLEHRDSDALLMIDTDMAFTRATILQMWDAYQRLPGEQGPEAQILGGLAFTLSGPRLDPRLMRPTIYIDDPERGEPFMVQMLTYPPDALMRVAGTGAACLIVSREVLEKCSDNGNAFAIYGLPDGDRMGEDLSFCRRARDRGYTIHVHTGCRFDHAKTVLFGESEYRPVLNAYRDMQEELPTPLQQTPEEEPCQV